MISDNPHQLRDLFLSKSIRGGYHLLHNMRKALKTNARACGLAAVSFVLCPLVHGARIQVYISSPGSQASPIAGSTTETFDALPFGIRTTAFVSTIGTYALSATNAFSIQTADQYGGANGTRYMAIGSQSVTSAPVTLTLPAPQTYFGFWWSAGDANNGLSFYLSGGLLARFNTADIISILTPPPDTLQAIDGNLYLKSRYFGNPNLPSGRNTGEPYAYVLFVGDGVRFDQIVFDNSGTTASGFESDNHSIFAGPVSIPTSSVFIRNVTSPALDAIPEPATMLLAAAGLGLLRLLRQRTCR